MITYSAIAALPLLLLLLLLLLVATAGSTAEIDQGSDGADAPAATPPSPTLGAHKAALWQQNIVKLRSKCKSGPAPKSLVEWARFDGLSVHNDTFVLDTVLEDVLLSHGWCGPADKSGVANLDRVFFLVMSGSQSSGRVEVLQRSWLRHWTEHSLITADQAVPRLDMVGPEGPGSTWRRNRELSKVIEEDPHPAR